MATLKVSELRSVLERFAKALESNKADKTVVAGIHELCGAFVGAEAKTPSAFMKQVRSTPLTSATTAPGAPIGAILPALESLRDLYHGLVSKTLLESLDSLLDVLRTNSRISIAAFVSAVVSASQSKRNGSKTVDQALIDDYVKRLEGALGEEDFKGLYEELRADSRVRQGEAVSIATRFFGRTPQSTSRSKALARIWERHRKLMEFKKNPSSAGRSAA